MPRSHEDRTYRNDTFGKNEPTPDIVREVEGNLQTEHQEAQPEN